MDVSFAWELPPVPDCFSKLLVTDSESSAVPSQPWREAERLRELKDIMLKSLALESVPEPNCVGHGNTDISEATFVENTANRASRNSGAGDSKRDCSGGKVEVESVNTEAQEAQLDTSSNSTLCRLNTALHRLKQEMVDLRHMDMSLFCQLLSLNEAIQDFKISVNDRCSDYTGSEYTCSEYASSEYSVGGMGSRTGSLSSLMEEAGDWAGDFGGQHDDPSSTPTSPGSGQLQNQNSDMAASTSSLLQQIKALTQRAEADF